MILSLSFKRLNGEVLGRDCLEAVPNPGSASHRPTVPPLQLPTPRIGETLPPHFTTTHRP